MALCYTQVAIKGEKIIIKWLRLEKNFRYCIAQPPCSKQGDTAQALLDSVQ